MVRVAICHDYLTQRGGAERAVLALGDAFPDAPIHTSLYDPAGTFPEYRDRDVRPMWIDRVPGVRGHHRAALPAYPVVFSSTTIDAELTICSSSGWAHGVRTTGRKVVYCYAPARWLYQQDHYLGTASASAARAGLAVARRPLLAWDRRAATSADRYLAISSRSRDLIRSAYGIEAEVLPPPHSIDPTASMSPLPIEPGFHLAVSRLLPYKNVSELVEAFRQLPDERLVLVGEGPLRTHLEARRPANVELVGRVGDAQLRWLYANAVTLIAVSYEDLGLTPVEAALFGTPTLALRFGGYLDTVTEGATGHFVDEPTPAAIAAGVRVMREETFDPGVVRAGTDRFGKETFEARLHEIVAEELGAGTPPPSVGAQ